VDTLAFEHHLVSPQGSGRLPAAGCAVTVDGGACCDQIRFSVRLEGDRITDAGFVAKGCGAATAAGSAAVTLVRRRPLLEAALIGAREISSELGGLSPGKLHAAELAADALARSLGAAARADARMARAPQGRTLVAISGGVDSSVAALRCAEEGETLAVTLELWSDAENDEQRSCCSASAVAQARALSHSLGLPHFTIDLRPEFRAGVVDPFIAGHADGETPNPCVGCNGHVRLDAMLVLADRLGCEQLATGHYARVVDRDHEQGPLLALAADRTKDQTYMLAALSPSSLARMRFPLGGLTKPEVRRIAAAAGLEVAGKPDSQDLCFLAGTNRARFLARHGELRERQGTVIDRAGNVLALHRGQHHFTVGQRRGLGVAGGEPLYVLDRDPVTNQVTVGPAAALRTSRVALRGVRLHRPGAQVDRVKLRYRTRPLAARLTGDAWAGHHRSLELELTAAPDVAAPGQLACLMGGERVIGWGTITRR
jgi:tRNA-uridine 2-sulfurtransferase